jgi:hypothetical protein
VKKRKPPKWKLERTVWEWVLAVLRRGVESGLDEEDCAELVELVESLLPRGPGNPADPALTENRARQMAYYYRLLELDGALPKNALADTMKMFDVKRSAVMAARRQHKASLIYGMNPAMRTFWRHWVEQGEWGGRANFRLRLRSK